MSGVDLTTDGAAGKLPEKKGRFVDLSSKEYGLKVPFVNVIGGVDFKDQAWLLNCYLFTKENCLREVLSGTAVHLRECMCVCVCVCTSHRVSKMHVCTCVRACFFLCVVCARVHTCYVGLGVQWDEFWWKSKTSTQRSSICAYVGNFTFTWPVNTYWKDIIIMKLLFKLGIYLGDISCLSILTVFCECNFLSHYDYSDSVFLTLAWKLIDGFLAHNYCKIIT